MINHIIPQIIIIMILLKNTVHADYTNEGDTDNAPAVRDNPVDFDNLGVSDYPESHGDLYANNTIST